ncbi:hypothetical protein CR513_02897, partial [Mucuna pruriens]
MHYLKRAKWYIAHYWKSDRLEISRYCGFDFVGYQDRKRPTSRYVYMLVGGIISWKYINQSFIAPSFDHGCRVCILYSNNKRSSTKSKFIDIKFLIVKERVQNKQISIKHIGMSFILINLLTKELKPKVFHEHIAHMDVVP